MTASAISAAVSTFTRLMPGDASRATGPETSVTRMPSDLGAGTSAELEEERRLLYVAMTRAKDALHLVVPQRFFVRVQHAQGDRHLYASRTRFIPEKLLGLFERTSWPVVSASAAARSASQGPKLDIGARMRGMWR